MDDNRAFVRLAEQLDASMEAQQRSMDEALFASWAPEEYARPSWGAWLGWRWRAVRRYGSTLWLALCGHDFRDDHQDW